MLVTEFRGGTGVLSVPCGLRGDVAILADSDVEGAWNTEGVCMSTLSRSTAAASS